MQTADEHRQESTWRDSEHNLFQTAAGCSCLPPLPSSSLLPPFPTPCSWLLSCLPFPFLFFLSQSPRPSVSMWILWCSLLPILNPLSHLYLLAAGLEPKPDPRRPGPRDSPEPHTPQEEGHGQSLSPISECISAQGDPGQASLLKACAPGFEGMKERDLLSVGVDLGACFLWFSSLLVHLLFQ